MAGWFGRLSETETQRLIDLQLEQEKLKLEAMQMATFPQMTVSQGLVNDPGHSHYSNLTAINTLPQYHANPYAQTSSVFNSTASGLGSYTTPSTWQYQQAQAALAQAKYAQQAHQAQLNAQPVPYYVPLPTKPIPGDKITIRYDGTAWREERHCFNEQDKSATPDNHAGFSLRELEDAQQIMDECLAPA